MSTNHSSPGRAALLDGGEGVAAARGDGVGVAAATPTELVAQQLGRVSRAPAQLELASCHAPCATPPDLRVRGFVVVEEVERVAGALLVVNICVLDTVELHPDGDLAVLVTQVHVHDDGVNKQADVVSAVPELNSLSCKHFSCTSHMCLVGVIKF